MKLTAEHSKKLHQLVLKNDKVQSDQNMSVVCLVHIFLKTYMDHSQSSPVILILSVLRTPWTKP